MAKRGQYFPYRIKFRYPNEVKGTLVLMTPEDVARERDELLRRGATVETYKVHPNGIWDLKTKTTPDEWLDERAVSISRRALAEISDLLELMYEDHDSLEPDDLAILGRIGGLRAHLEAAR